MNNSEFLIAFLMSAALGFGSYDIAEEYVLKKYKNDKTMQPEKVKMRITVFTIAYIAFIFGASFVINLICR